MDISQYEKICQQKKISQKLGKSAWNVRVFQKNLIFITGVPEALASINILTQKIFLGQYGQIKQIWVKKTQQYKEVTTKDKLSFQVHVMYNNQFEASLALLCLDDLKLDGDKIKAFYGMTRYCPRLLHQQQCSKTVCPYLHQIAKQEDCFLKNDQAKKLFFQSYDKKKIFMDLIKSNLQNNNVTLYKNNNLKYTFFPKPSQIIDEFIYNNFDEILKISQKIQHYHDQQIYYQIWNQLRIDIKNTKQYLQSKILKKQQELKILIDNNSIQAFQVFFLNLEQSGRINQEQKILLHKIKKLNRLFKKRDNIMFLESQLYQFGNQLTLLKLYQQSKIQYQKKQQQAKFLYKFGQKLLKELNSQFPKQQQLINFFL